MSDILQAPSFKIPHELIRQLKESDVQLAIMKKNIDALKSIGIDVTELESTYKTVSTARSVLLEAFGK